MKLYFSPRNITALLLSILIIGWGLCLLGRASTAARVQVYFYLALFFTISSRLITGVFNFKLLLTIYIIFTLVGVIVCLTSEIQNKKSNIVAIVYPFATLSVLALIFILKPWVFGIQLYRIYNSSMEPTFYNGDIILVDTWKYHVSAPLVNDIVLFRTSDSAPVYIKRITRPSKKSEGLNKDHYFVLGDNKAKSIDSRHFGAIKKDKILGKFIFIVYSSKSQITSGFSWKTEG